MPGIVHKFTNRLSQRKLRGFRNLVQIIIEGSLMVAGVEFYFFVGIFKLPVKYPLPPGRRWLKLLPISSLMSLKCWLLTGVFDPHPAGLAIFLAVILTALSFKKGFGSWICPIALSP